MIHRLVRDLSCESNIYLSSSTSDSSKIFFIDRSKAVLFFFFFLLFMFPVHHAVLSVNYSLVVTCLERAGLFALLCVMISFVFCHFPMSWVGCGT